MGARKLMAVLAHPDDESLGFGGTLAKYAAEGVEVVVLTATRGESGRYRGIRPGEPGHPGRDELARLREQELRAAARRSASPTSPSSITATESSIAPIRPTRSPVLPATSGTGVPTWCSRSDRMARTATRITSPSLN